jgi:protein-S-isoprenylcysteine O-methyltransferase Ste14
MYYVSSAFGAQLYAGHRLVTTGPYAIVRHPLYLGLILAGIGGLFIYWTWTLVLVLACGMGVTVRAGREEAALRAEFGAKWEAYAQRVPAWLPRLRRGSTRDRQGI